MSRNGIEFNDLIKFQKNIDRVQKVEVEKYIEKCSKDLAAILLTKVVKRTPVGDYSNLKDVKKLGGTLRRGWTCKTHQEAENGTGEGKPINDYVKNLRYKKEGKSYIITIFNPVNYAVYVEFGHRQTPGRYVPALGKRLKKSWVTGRFMLTKAMLESESMVLQVMQSNFEKYFKGVFDV